MRLWHYELIPVLPRKQLLAQWRECCAIISNIAKNGTPNHILVNKILEYPQIHFVCYTNKILNEMSKRSYRVNQGSYERFVENMNASEIYFPVHDDNIEEFFNKGKVFPGWHNDRYYEQCFRNLQEKYDCGMFEEKEYAKLRKAYIDHFTKED